VVVFSKILNFFLYIFLNCFDMLILKMIFFKKKKHHFNVFLNEKHLMYSLIYLVVHLLTILKAGCRTRIAQCTC
jgi:hypothetical protein